MLPNNPPAGRAGAAAVPVVGAVPPNRPPGFEPAAPKKEAAPVPVAGAVLGLAVLVDPAAVVAVAGFVELPPPNSPPEAGAPVEPVANPKFPKGFGAVLEDAAPPNKLPGVTVLVEEVAVADEGFPKRPVLGCWAVLPPPGLVVFEVVVPKPVNPVNCGGPDIIVFPL